MRATVADAANDHRLGGDEAPPAIISVYLGSYLSGLLDEIEAIGKLTSKKMERINLGVRNLPKVAKDISDRNRTSPLAFTGNKFEFRAVGSSQNPAESITALNLMATYGFDYIYEKLSKMKGDMKENAILVLRDILKQTKSVRFEGNGYSEDWLREAKERGLENHLTTPQALSTFLEKDTIKLFEKYEILSPAEIQRKVDIKLDAYIKTLAIEFKTAINIAETQIIPAILKHINIVSGAYNSLMEMKIPNEELRVEVVKIHELYIEIRKEADELKEFLVNNSDNTDLMEKAKDFALVGKENLQRLRAAVDNAEKIVDDHLWPIAKYQELLNML